MLWLALHFPALALDVLARGARETGPLAVASSTDLPTTLGTVASCWRVSLPSVSRQKMWVGGA
ncbi:MAG: hypothetical protein K6T59_13235 [Bryobacteraceae bacterium]|nr:hypothetical protein [Bryobacteraceae bacterium]